ncbi:MAG: hypothetical protein IJX53_02505 [Clostridia bacterium]|nr:hypothetical protein [Clostridia bacterium]
MCDRREQLDRRSAEAARLGQNSYFAYLLASLRATSLWGLWQQLLTAVRRWRLLSAILRWSTIILTWLETSAVFLLAVTALLAAGLPLLVGAGVMLSVGLLQHRRCNAALSAHLAGRHIYVCVAARGALEPDSYFHGMVRALADRADSAVIVVSPYFWRSHGRAYVTMRRDGENLYLIRRHYFFSLRRRVLRPNSARVTILY